MRMALGIIVGFLVGGFAGLHAGNLRRLRHL